MQRLRIPDVLTGAFGVALLASLFVPWYSLGGVEVTATEAFGFIDLWLLLLAAMAIGVTVVTAVRDTPALPVAMDVMTVWIGLVATLLVLFRVLSTPGPGGVGREWGLWLGSACVLGVLAGAYRAMRVEAAPGLRSNPVPEPMPAPPPEAPVS